METNSSKVRICPDKEGNVVRVWRGVKVKGHVAEVLEAVKLLA